MTYRTLSNVCAMEELCRRFHCFAWENSSSCLVVIGISYGSHLTFEDADANADANADADANAEGVANIRQGGDGDDNVREREDITGLSSIQIDSME